MKHNPIFLGIDLGTRGVRIAAIDDKGNLIYEDSMEYTNGLEIVRDWEFCCRNLLKNLPKILKTNLIAIGVDGTSGTIAAFNSQGKPLGPALPYFISCPEFEFTLKQMFPQGNTNSSIARALRLQSKYGSKILLRHQADWVNGWLIQDWKWGEEGNNLRLGWDLLHQKWPSSFNSPTWKNTLPKIIKSAHFMGTISPEIADDLEIPKKVLVIAGTTDSNAAVLAARPGPEDGITVLGSTIVIKRFVKHPIQGEGITNHRVEGLWLSGGASNSGGAILTTLFSDKELQELSRQINPETNSGLNLLPLHSQGERFPINDPTLKPILEPRPISDSLYLHGLLEGLARIEAKGWETLISMGAKAPKRIITIGGGSKNPQWRRIRERAVGLPIRTCNNSPAFGVANLVLRAVIREKNKTDKYLKS